MSSIAVLKKPLGSAGRSEPRPSAAEFHPVSAPARSAASADLPGSVSRSRLAASTRTKMAKPEIKAQTAE